VAEFAGLAAVAAGASVLGQSGGTHLVGPTATGVVVAAVVVAVVVRAVRRREPARSGR